MAHPFFSPNSFFFFPFFSGVCRSSSGSRRRTLAPLPLPLFRGQRRTMNKRPFFSASLSPPLFRRFSTAEKDRISRLFRGLFFFPPLPLLAFFLFLSPPLQTGKPGEVSEVQDFTVVSQESRVLLTSSSSHAPFFFFYPLLLWVLGKGKEGAPPPPPQERRFGPSFSFFLTFFSPPPVVRIAGLALLAL